MNSKIQTVLDVKTRIGVLSTAVTELTSQLSSARTEYENLCSELSNRSGHQYRLYEHQGKVFIITKWGLEEVDLIKET
jgi:hypothetical protein